MFQFESYPLSARTVLAPEELYHYVMQEKSLTHVFNAGAKRMDKVDAHLLVLHEVLERWDRRGLLDLCPGELVTWFLDLVVFEMCIRDRVVLLVDGYDAAWLSRFAMKDACCSCPAELLDRVLFDAITAAGDSLRLACLMGKRCV